MNSIDIWNDLGNLYLKANAPDAAIGAFSRAVDQGFTSAEIYSNLASAYVIQGKVIDSIPLYLKSTELMTDQKQKAIVYTRLGDCYRQIAEYDKAIAAFKTAIDIEPGNPALCEGLGEVQRDLERLFGFENSSEFQNGKQVGALSSTIITDQESDRQISMDTPAVKANDDVLLRMPPVEEISPNSSFASDMKVYEGTSRYDVPDVSSIRIVDTIEHSIASEKELIPIEITENEKKQEISDSEKEIQASAKEEPRDNEEGVRATLLLTLGIMHWRNGDLEDADGILQTAVEVSVKLKNNWFEALSWHALALVKTALGDIVSAINAYLRAMELAPEQIFPWNNLGSLYGNMGCTDKALAAYQTAIKKYPEDSTSWDGLGDIYTKMGRIDDAIAAYQLGNVFEKRSQGDDAIKVYEKAFDFYKFTISSLESHDNLTQVPASVIEKSTSPVEDMSPVTGDSNSDTRQEDPFPIMSEKSDLLKDCEEILTEAVGESQFENVESDQRVTAYNAETPGSLEAILKVEGHEQLDQEPTNANELAQKNDFEIAGSADTLLYQNYLKMDLEIEGLDEQEELVDSILDSSINNYVDNPVIEREEENKVLIVEDSLFEGDSNLEKSSTSNSTKILITEQENEIIPQVRAFDQEDVLSKISDLINPTNRIQEIFEEILPPVVSIDPTPEPNTDPERVSGEIASYEAVVRENPRNDRAWDSLGNLYRFTQRNKDAIYAYERAVLVQPNKYVYHYQLGNLYAAEGNYQDAIYEIEKVIELNPCFTFAHCALASCLRKLGRADEAQKHIIVATPLMAKEKEYDRACFESICGNVEKALALLTTAIEKNQTTLEWIRRDSDLDFIREDPRYKLFESKFSRSVIQY